MIIRHFTPIKFIEENLHGMQRIKGYKKVKSVFGISDQGMFKPVCLATKTRQKIEISLVACLDVILFD